CEIIGNCHPRHGANVEQSLLKKNVAHFVIRLCPTKSKAVMDLAILRPRRAKLQKSVRLPPGAASLLAGSQARMHEHLRAPAPKTCAEVFQLGARLHRDDEKRRRARSAHEIEKRAVAGNKLVPQKSMLEYLRRIFTARSGGGNGNGKIADFDGRIARGFQFDIPIERGAVRAE